MTCGHRCQSSEGEGLVQSNSHMHACTHNVLTPSFVFSILPFSLHLLLFFIIIIIPLSLSHTPSSAYSDTNFVFSFPSCSLSLSSLTPSQSLTFIVFPTWPKSPYTEVAYISVRWCMHLEVCYMVGPASCASPAHLRQTG